VVILSNLDSFKPEYLVEEIANYLLPETNSVYDDSKPEVEKYEGKLTPVRASNGWYKTNPLPVHYTSDYWRITQSDNDLYFHPSSREEIKLINDSNTDFKLENTPLNITFHRNMQNNEFLLSVNGPEGPMYAEKISNDTFNFDINSSTEVEGVYYSPELNVEYELFIEDSKLKVRHHSPFVNRRWDPFVLHPIKKDSFISDRSFFQIVEFIRDSNDKIIGLKVSSRGQRVENLWFEKTN
jgi:hypothetical protein